MEEFRRYKPQSSQFSLCERRIFDVFLSFRGPDVRKTLADHLYQSLCSKGLRVFTDSEELEKGKDIGWSLQQAIQNSTIHIPIFSPDYASSVWCLREVSLMLELNCTGAHIMIPLFYNVEPSHVRHALGSYAEAFDRHHTQGRCSPQVIRDWKNVLHKVACLSGWSLETFSGYEGKLVNQVVEDVVHSLDLGMQDVAQYSVGLKPCIEELRELLKLGDEKIGRLTLGILGISGLGKTNLSKALYNEVRHLFNAASFVSKVKLEDSRHCLIKLQQQILKDLLRTKIELNDLDHGKIAMRIRLASLKALVVLDDVDNVQQLDALMGDWFGEGSRIIITTQNERLLKVRQVDVIYPMRGLEVAEAMELFCWHAFRRENPKSGYEDMAERIVKTCSGLPLALEIAGADLFGRDKNRYWPEVMDKLETVGHDSVFKTLRISYDNLGPVEQHIFLDIACLFVEIKSRDFVSNRPFSKVFYVRFWNAFGFDSVFASLETLKEKGLIVMHERRYIEGKDDDVNEEDHTDHYFCEFSMHDQIRDMGRRIILEESLNDPSKRSRVWREEDIRSLMAATAIQENSGVEGLMWRRRMELEHLDALVPLHKLGFLLWWELQVETAIKRLPTSLKYLVLSDCQLKDYDPQMVGTESGSDINGSSVLPSVLPKSAASIESRGDRNSLVKLQIKRIARNLKHMASSKTRLEQRDPQMTGNSSGRDSTESPASALSSVLPDSIAQLKYLRYLDMSGTKQNRLPEEICEIHCLEELYLSRCNLKALPEAFGNLIKLEILDVSQNFLSEFPPSFGRLKSLRNLEMAWNEQLVAFPTLPMRLITLGAKGCSKVQTISLTAHLLLLKTMDLSHCKSLTGLSVPVTCRSLRDLKLDGCKELEKLEHLPECVASIRTSGCSKLQTINFNRAPVSLYAPQKASYSPDTLFECAGSCSAPAETDFFKIEMKELCLIGCEKIRLNVYQLLKAFPRLERLDLSLSSEVAGESQPLIGQKNLTLHSCNLCVAIFFCLEVTGRETAHLPQIDVLMTCLDDFDGSLVSKAFHVPSRMKGDESGENIMRVCIWDTKSVIKEGTASCSYSVHDRPSQHGNHVVLRQVEFLALEEKAISKSARQFLQNHQLLFPFEDIFTKSLTVVPF